MVSGSLVRGAVARGGRLGQARGDLRQVAGRKHLPGSSSADQPPSLHAPTLTDDAKCCRPAIGAMRRVTFAKRGRWAESGLSGSTLDQLVGAFKKTRRIAPPLKTPHTSPQRKTSHTVQDQVRVAHALRMQRRVLTSRRGPKSVRLRLIDTHYQRPSPTTLAHYFRPLRDEMATDALPPILPLCLHT